MPRCRRGGPGAAGLVGAAWTTWSPWRREWAVPTLVSPETHRSATSVQFPGTAGVLPGFGRFDPCDWGLGVEIRGTKQPHWTGTTNSAGHLRALRAQRAPSCGSIRWPGWPARGSSDRPFGPWAAQAWPVLADAVLAEVAAMAAGPGDRPVRAPSRLRRMKGVILAGGTGSRLHPLTRITNKHLLPIYDRPMINWGIEALVNAEITEIMLVTGGTHAGEFLRLLGNGQRVRHRPAQLRLPGPARRHRRGPGPGRPVRRR